MTIGASINVTPDKKLVVLGKEVLTQVHHNILLTPSAGDAFVSGAFIGVHSDRIGSRRVFPVGKLQFVSLFSLLHFRLLIPFFVMHFG